MTEEILRQLTDEELQIFVKLSGMKIFIEPLKINPQKYQRYIKFLGGRIREDNPVLRLNLPKIAPKIYRSGDKTYGTIFEGAAGALIMTIDELIAKETGQEAEDVHPEGLKAEELARIMKAYLSGGYTVPACPEAMWLYLKLKGLQYPEAEREKVEALLNISEESDDEPEETAPETIPETSPEVKTETKRGPKKESKKERRARLEQQRLQKEKERREKEKKEKQERLAREKELREKKELERQKQLEKEQREKEEKEQASKADQAGRNTAYSTASGGKGVSGGTQSYGSVWSGAGRKTYIGKINIYRNYYNFTPLYQKDKDGVWHAMLEYEVTQLLDNAVFKNIEFTFNPYVDEERDFAESRLRDNQLVVLEFDKKELEPNLDSSGVRKNTEYMIRAYEMYKKGLIRFLSEEGYYQIHSGAEILDELGSKKAIRVAYENIVEGEDILIDAGDGFLAGPYKVKDSPSSIGYYVSTDISENNFVLSGYKESDCRRIKFRDSNYSWSTGDQWEYYYIDPSCRRSAKDTISSGALLRLYKTDGENRKFTDSEDESETLDSFDDAVFVGENIPDSIRRSRAEKLKELLASMKEEDGWNKDALDIVYKLIIRNPDSSRSKEIVDEIIKLHPDLLDNVSGIKKIEDRIERGRLTLKSIEDNISQSNKKQEKADADIRKSLEQKQRHLDSILERLEIANDIDTIRKGYHQAEKKAKTYEDRIASLKEDSSILEERFSEMIDSYSKRIAEIAFDGFVSGKMLEAASEWSNEKQKEEYDSAARSVNSVKSDFNNVDDMVDYLVETIQIARPQYDRNLIINIITCISQGFLTVFSGPPGCGKTSICNIIANVMGLTGFEDMLREPCETCDVNRYIQVSVERGWTSKRDFIGYYNPLTRSFEENNKSVLNGLRILDYEARNNMTGYPYYILLDEANLSPMEYYWADFMNACDDSELIHSINLGNDNIFRLPETLHFLATINNDNTTEELSPRLIDRAWTITLPGSVMKYGDTIPEKDIRVVPWNLLREAFYGDPVTAPQMDSEISRIYLEIRKHLRIQEYEISPRSDFAIRRYCSVAAEYMEDEEFSSSKAVALDYAVSQKLLPKIEGSGDDYKEWLQGLRDLCYNRNLYQSANIVKSIIERGDKKNMGYYRFF